MECLPSICGRKIKKKDFFKVKLVNITKVKCLNIAKGKLINFVTHYQYDTGHIFLIYKSNLFFA